MTQMKATMIAMTLFAGMMFHGEAEAGHRSFCYTGKCYGFRGEQRMINALAAIDDAYYARFHADAIQATNRARRQVHAAYRQVCTYEAKKTLLAALRSLNRFSGGAGHHHLQKAADRVNRSMIYEQRAQIQPAQIRRQPPVRVVPQPQIVPQPPVVTRRIAPRVHPHLPPRLQPSARGSIGWYDLLPQHLRRGYLPTQRTSRFHFGISF